MDELLSIIIPTYNRCDVLKGCLEKLAPQAQASNIKIYVFDNVSTDNTKSLVKEFSSRYSNIIYSRNDKVEHDTKLKKILALPKSRYIWVMGDRVRVVEGAIKKVMSILISNAPDLLVINSFVRAKTAMVRYVKGPRMITDPNYLLSELGWSMTFLGVTIWSSKIVKEGKFQKYEGTEYVQVGTIFDFLAEHGSKVYWEPEPLIYAVGRSGWLAQLFETAITKWISVIDLLPPYYTDQARAKCIKDLNTKSCSLKLNGLIQLRSLGVLDLNSYRKFKDQFKRVTDTPLILIFFIAIVPRPIAHFLESFKRIKNILNPKLT